MSDADACCMCQHCGGIHVLDDRNRYPCIQSKTAHAKKLMEEREHWLIKLARKVAGTPGARAALNSAFIVAIKGISNLADVRAAVAALAEAEAILEGNL